MIMLLYNIIKIKFRINTIKYIYSNNMSTGLIPPGSNIYTNNPTPISPNFDQRIIETTGVPYQNRQTIVQSQPYITTGSQVSSLPLGTMPRGTQQFNQGTILQTEPVRVSNVINTQSPLVLGSQVRQGGYQTISRVQQTPVIREQPIQVFRATGPPIAPFAQTAYRPAQSIVRPVNILRTEKDLGRITEIRQPSVAATQHQIQRPVTYKEPIYQTTYKQRNDPQRDQRKSYYQGPGYTQNVKGFPWIKALIGLLALAGLLTGLFFLIRALNDGSNAQTVTRQPVDFKQNATANATVPSQPLSPVVIDVNTNPSGTNSTNTTGNTNTTINTNTSNSTNTTTVTTTNATNVNPIVVPPTTVNFTTVNTISTTNTTNNITTNNISSNTTNNISSNTTSISSNTTQPVPAPGNVVTVNGSTPTQTNNTNTNTTTTTTSNTNPSNTTASSTTPSSTTPSSTTTSNTTTTNISNNSGNAAVTLTAQQIASDPSVKTIDSFLKQQDASRLGTNPALNSVTKTTLNGEPVYYFIYDAGQGKKYHYWVSLTNNQPQVKAVKITLQPIPTAHELQLTQRHKLHLQSHQK